MLRKLTTREIAAMESNNFSSDQKPFRSRFSYKIKLVSFVVLGTFLMRDAAWALDYNSLRKDQKEQSSSFLPGYLKAQQAKHEDMIKMKEDALTLKQSVDSKFAEKVREVKPELQILEQPKGRSGAGKESLLKYTL